MSFMKNLDITVHNALGEIASEAQLPNPEYFIKEVSPFITQVLMVHLNGKADARFAFNLEVALSDVYTTIERSLP